MHQQNMSLIEENQPARAANLMTVVQNFQLQYFLQPTLFYGYARDFLNFEREILELPLNENPPTLEIDRINAIMDRIMFWVEYNAIEVQRFEENLQRLEENEAMTFLRKMELFTDTNEIILVKAIDCLNRWKKNQKTYNRLEKLFCGDEGLLRIQTILQNLLCILDKTRMHMTRLFSIGLVQIQNVLNQNLNLLRRLIIESVIVEVQPPQVLRTNTM